MDKPHQREYPSLKNLFMESENIPKRKTISFLPCPIKIICDDPATIIFWNDGTKTVVNCDKGGTIYDKNGKPVGIREPDKFTIEGGVSAAYIKKIFGTRGKFKKMLETSVYVKKSNQKKKKQKSESKEREEQ